MAQRGLGASLALECLGHDLKGAGLAQLPQHVWI